MWSAWAQSAARSEEIGAVIADAMEKVGKDGVVNVEEGQTLAMQLEFTEGMQFDKGYVSPHFVTDQERMESVLDDPYILIASQKIGNAQDLLPILNQVMTEQQAAPDHLGRSGRRGAGGPDRQQGARHVATWRR